MYIYIYIYTYIFIAPLCGKLGRAAPLVQKVKGTIPGGVRILH